MPENAFNRSALESLLDAGVLGLKVYFFVVNRLSTVCELESEYLGSPT